MKKVQEKLAESMEFNDPFNAYIHAEMRNGGKVETIINGGRKAVVWALGACIEDVAKKMDCKPVEILGLINALYEVKNEEEKKV